MATKKRITTPENELLDTLTIGQGRKKRRLSEEDRKALTQMLAIKVKPSAFDIVRLAPRGSYIARMMRHFEDTDISYALPLMQLVMVAASWLTQRGAYVDVPGLGKIVPTLWTVGLAESADAKTLATDEVMRILSWGGQAPVNLLPTGSSDAQWIEDLAANNGSYWFQDEVGKFFRCVLTHSNYQRIKPWMLDAYSYKTISNRLKGEKQKRVIESPMFTFFGLSVFSTWKMDIDLTSMLDGFCQRMNYFLAPSREDTDMFDHFLYFTGPDTDQRRSDLYEMWQALCSQENAEGPYRLNSEVLPFLEDWWQSLRVSWGNTPLPKSFIRRIGFSLMRYLPTLHFLLGKARHPIDLETAQLATCFAEFHFESTLAVLQDYDQGATSQVQKVAELRSRLLAEGADASARNISRRLSSAWRKQLTGDRIKEITAVLESIEEVPGLIVNGMEQKEKSGAMADRLDQIRHRYQLNERKRNERRLRKLLEAYRQRTPDEADAIPAPQQSPFVVDIDTHRAQSKRAASG